jgi:hypothetical protein
MNDMTLNSRISWIESAALGLRSKEIMPAFAELLEKTDGQIAALPAYCKFDLIEALYASTFPDKQKLLAKVFRSTELNEVFIFELVVKPVEPEIFRELGSIGNKEERDLEILVVKQIHLQFEEPSAFVVRNLPKLSKKSKMFLLVAAILGGGLTQQARETLGKIININDEFYSLLKQQIQQVATWPLGPNPDRTYGRIAVELFKLIASEGLSSLEDAEWLELGTLLLRVPRENAVTAQWRAARLELFEQMPILKGMQEHHNIVGAKLVENMLNDQQFVELAIEAEARWGDESWQSLLEKKIKYTEALYAHLGEAYGVDAPTVEIGPTDDDMVSDKNEPRASYQKFSWVPDEEEGRRLKWRNVVVFSSYADKGLNQIFNKTLVDIFHEFGHCVEGFVSLGFHAFEMEIYLRSGGMRAAPIPENHSLYPAAIIFTHSTGYYSSACSYTRLAMDPKLYLAQPGEKHARWAADHLQKYYGVFRRELAEKEKPGSYSSEVKPLVNRIAEVSSAFIRLSANENPAELRLAQKLIARAPEIKKLFNSSAMPGVENLGQLVVFLGEADTFLDQCRERSRSYPQAHAAFDNLKSQISALAVPEYLNFKKHQIVKELSIIVQEPTVPKAFALETEMHLRQ